MKYDFKLWFKRSLLVILPTLSALSITGMILGRQQQAETAGSSSTHPTKSPATVNPSANSSTNPGGPLATGKPLLPAPQPGGAGAKAGGAKAGGAKATPAPAPSAVPLGPDGRPIYTAAEQALNEQAKARFQNSRSVDAFVEMKVAIANGVGSASVGASSGAQVVDQTGKPLGQLPAGQSVNVSAGGGTVQVGSISGGAVVQILPSPQGLLYLGNRGYHGSFTLAADGGRLWVVNHVNLRQYLFSVVGSEVSPSWPLDALKAQSVAARSYALTYYFKPVNSLYHMGSDEYFQVYSGTEKEADTTRQAVDATAGEFVSYKGGIVESLYAASDDIVAEAFQGKGMSQLGALNLAERGVGYQQILANYYPGTAVGRIELDF